MAKVLILKKYYLGKFYKSDHQKVKGIYGASLGFIASDVHSLLEGTLYSYTNHHMLENE